MTASEPARTAARRTILAAAVGGLVGVLVYQSLASSSSSVAAPSDIPHGDQVLPRRERSPTAAPSTRLRQSRAGNDGALGEADGVVPEGVTVFDDEFPAVAKLDPALLGALRQAATDAADDGVNFRVNSGWRSPAYQDQLLREAIAKYGSEAEAARWVATADTSAHVSGDAIDIGPFDATVWLSEHGAEYGLCQIYGNEPWHYELRSEAIADGCPPKYPDPTHDPRMRQ